jgi:apolipoprotein N-acyltransferase
LYPALFAVVTARVCARLGPRGLWLAPATWVATEVLRRWVLGGFPWVVLGASQAGQIPIVQVASLAGVYGLSALVVLVSVAGAMLVVARGRLRMAAPVAVSVIVAGITAWGSARVADGTLVESGTPLRVAMVQGNIRQEEKWDRSVAPRILDTYLGLTRQAAAEGARLVVWPESSTPFYFEHDVLGNSAIRMTVRDTGVTLLFGSDQYEAGPPARYYNSAFVLGPDGGTAGIYRKMHLVPFGEFVPLKRLLFFVSPLVENVADFSAGTEAVVVPTVRQGGKPAAHHDHQRCVVREIVRAASALLAGVAARGRAGALPRARGQYGDQRHRGSVRAGRHAVRTLRAARAGRRRAAARRPHRVQPHGRRVRVRLPGRPGRCVAGDASRRAAGGRFAVESVRHP